MGYKTLLSCTVAGVLIGVALVVLTAGLYHASGSPGFCISCHSMKDPAAGWVRSTHRQFECIECHLGGANPAEVVLYKAKVGIRDLYYETLRSYPAYIRLSADSRRIAEGNCLRCHLSTVENTFMTSGDPGCLSCHRGVVHGPVSDIGGVRVE
jgi:cytochrome c nitrite reductase small subunit